MTRLDPSSARSRPAAPASARRWAQLWLVALLAVGTVCCRDRTDHVPSASQPQAPTASAAASSSAAEPQTWSLLDELPLCDIRHEGVAIDAASDWADAHRGFLLGPFDDTTPVARATVPTARVLTPKLAYDVWLDRPVSDVYVSVRVQGQAASRVALEVDAQRIGEQRLPSDEPAVLTFGPVKRELAAGRHVVALRFSGRAKQKSNERALLDWLRIHLEDPASERYVAPTHHNLLHDVVLEDHPRRSLALRAPGSARCALFVTRGTRLQLDVGYWGTGRALARVRVLTPGRNEVVLAETEVSAEEQQGKWTPLELSLDAFDQQLVALEFEAVESSAGGRVAFAEPRLSAPAPSTHTTRARNVIVLVAAGISRRLVPPWADRHNMPNLFALSQQSLVFEGYRANSTLVPAVLTTLLSGAGPLDLRWSDLSTAVAEEVPLIGQKLRRNGDFSGFFTNVPYSFAAFGFDRGWNEFAQYSPVSDLPGTQPLREGRLWLERTLGSHPEARRLLVVHLTAAHPPWDVTLDEAKELPPKDYVGSIDARRGAQALSDLRSAARPRSPTAMDWVRLSALQGVALRKFDQSLGNLIRTLEKAGQWDDSLVVFIGDVAMGEPPATPLAPMGNLEEARLTPPLLVKFPGQREARRVITPLGTESVARTLHEALGVTWQGSAFAAPLQELAADGQSARGVGGLLALQGQTYTYALGPWLLSGTFGTPPRLCEVEVDPTCQDERFAREPFVAQWLWRSLLRLANEPGRNRYPRRQAEIDAETRAALSAFGL